MVKWSALVILLDVNWVRIWCTSLQLYLPLNLTTSDLGDSGTEITMCWLFRNCKWLWWLSSDDDQCSAAVCWWQLCFCIDMWSTQSGTFVDRVTTTAGTPHANSEHGLGTALLQHDDSGCRQLWWSGECERSTISWSIWSWLTYQWYVMVFFACSNIYTAVVTCQECRPCWIFPLFTRVAPDLIFQIRWFGIADPAGAGAVAGAECSWAGGLGYIT